VSIADPLEKIPFRGWPRVDRKTAAALTVAEKRLGYQMDIVQGPYNSSVGPSAGTHAGGGVVDLSPYDWARKERVLREVGFDAWYRRAVPGLWPAHVHAVLHGHQDLSPSAQDQTEKYDRGEDGLANPPTPDPNPYRPERADFSYAAYLRDGRLEDKIEGIEAKRRKLLDKISAKRAKRERLRLRAKAARDEITYG
jgi:hypothetical protein